MSGYKVILNLMKIFLKTLMKKVMKDTFLKLMFNILKNYMNFMIYHFYLKIEKVKMPVTNLNDKTESVLHIKKFKTSIKSATNLGKS